MERENSNDGNVPKTEKVEYPDSKSEEEMEVGGGASLSSPNASSREEELLRSPGGEAEVAQECAAMDPATLEARRKERRREKERQRKRRKRQEERNAKREQRSQGSSQDVPSAAPAANDSPVASASASGQPGTGARSAPVQVGGPRVQTKLRGPLARKAAREAGKEERRRAFVLPTASAAVRGEEPGPSQGRPGSSSGANSKRPRVDKRTSPERRRKRARPAGPAAPVGGPAHV